MKSRPNAILVTGAGGQLGQELVTLKDAFPMFDFHFFSSKELDITQAQQVEATLKQRPWLACINCAAYTAVDKAEEEPDKAFAINALGPAHLAEACKLAAAHLIHISTDYVYHTSQNTPCKEDDPVDPQSVYARSKLAGELPVLEAGGMVVRTSWLYSTFGHNFVKTMLRLGNERKHLRVVWDQIGSPTWAHDLAMHLLEILRRVFMEKLPPDRLGGVYNYSNEGVASWYDFAMAIFELAQMDVHVEPIRTKEFPTPAKRPPFSLMDKSRFRLAFDLTLPHWRTSLRHMLEAHLHQPGGINS